MNPLSIINLLINKVSVTNLHYKTSGDLIIISNIHHINFKLIFNLNMKHKHMVFFPFYCFKVKLYVLEICTSFE